MSPRRFTGAIVYIIWPNPIYARNVLQRRYWLAKNFTANNICDADAVQKIKSTQARKGLPNFVVNYQYTMFQRAFCNQFKEWSLAQSSNVEAHSEFEFGWLN